MQYRTPSLLVIELSTI